jgi:dihydropteroate synthase
MHWQTTRFRIDLTTPKVMGIVNVTPDSFSDGGQHGDATSAIAFCERLVAEGADMLDIGGESSRPGAVTLTPQQELDRVLPVVREVVKLGVPISVDTCKPYVMKVVLDAGVDIINDIRALTADGAAQSVAAHPKSGVSLMHMRGDPATMQEAPRYRDVVQEVMHFLAERQAALGACGIGAERMVFDPGIGFGKSVEHNLALLARQDELIALGRPLLIGWSRKSTLGTITVRPVEERLAASLAAALAAIQRGARIVRVHDVRAMVDALTVWRVAGLVPSGGTMRSDDGD